VIALNSRTNEVLAIGHEAWQMIGRTPGYIVAVRPLRGGAITDFEITERLMRMLFQRAGVSRFYRTRVLICVPSAITHVEQRAVLEAARRAGAAQTFLIEQPMAAAIGASLPIHEPLGNMIVDVGGGTSEVAVISLGGVVALEAVRVGGFDVDAAIQAYVRREYGVAIGERTGEEIKIAIGSAFTSGDQYKAEVRGRDLTSGTAKVVVLSPEEVREAVDEPVRAILGDHRALRADAASWPRTSSARRPPRRRRRPAAWHGSANLERDHAARPPRRRALECVVHGAGRCLENFDRLKDMFMDRPRLRAWRPSARHVHCPIEAVERCPREGRSVPPVGAPTQIRN
jgi:rod shape-determining protein MreB